MAIKCISSHIGESEITPPVPPGFNSRLTPPGFAPLTTFILQKMQNNTSDAMRISRNVEHTSSNKGMLKKSFGHKPWIDYKLDNSSDDEESDTELVEPDILAVQRLPKGVNRGCSACTNCQTVTSQWRPEDACRPVLDEAPAFYPSEEEFKDTLKYIARIRPKAEPYGICRIIPPPSWQPSCPLKQKNAWVNSKFATRVQKINTFQNRESYKKNCSDFKLAKRKKRKLLEAEVLKNSYDGSAKTNLFGYHDNFGFECGPDFTLESFEKYANNFKEQYFQTRGGEPSAEEIEGEYWRIIERPTEEIEVLYGSDVETKGFGSGFPTASFDKACTSLEDPYVKSGWNLNNLPRLLGSMLAFESGDISGVSIPWLYIGMCFSSFCWHVEDHHLYSMNYLHCGAPKIWYGVPGKNALEFEVILKKRFPDLFEEQPDLLQKLVTQFSPSLLRKEGLPVYRCLQNAGEFILTFPRAYHSGFSCGFNCAEAVNVAPIDWLPQGQNAVEIYSQQFRKVTISHDKLLLEAAKEAVRAQWKIEFLGQNAVEDFVWKDACSPDGIFAKSLKNRIEMERARREFLCPPDSRKMDADFDANCERECTVCHYDLHLSAIGCSCSPNIYTCLTHSKSLCSCSWSKRFSLHRYEIDDLYTLLDALSGKLSAVHRWGLSHLGLSLSSSLTQERLSKSNISREKATELNFSVVGLQNNAHSREENAIRMDVDICCATNKENPIESLEAVASVNSNTETENKKDGNESISSMGRQMTKETKTVQNVNWNVEVLEYGVSLPGKLWSTSEAIFPKGYKSRVKYFSISEPTKKCYYISEILDAGPQGPLFMVKVENCSTEIFVHDSATKCWDLVRERLNNEILSCQFLGKANLPELQPASSIDGLRMFGLTSPSIIQDIEAMDSSHCCTEYWASRSQTLTSQLHNIIKQEELVEDVTEHSSEGAGSLHIDNQTYDTAKIYVHLIKDRKRYKFMESNLCGSACMESIKSRFDGFWCNFSDIPFHTKELMFQDFKSQFTWKRKHEWMVKKAWATKCRERFRDLLTSLKRKRRQPLYISTPIWQQYLAHWETHEFHSLPQT